MTLTELRYIVAVAREGHFGRAAEACHVSQPTLSLGVKKIESELGLPLFERGHHEIVVNADALELIDQAQQVLEQADRLREMAARRARPLAGRLRLGAISTVGPYLLPDLVAELRQQLPEMALMVEEDVSAKLTQRLRDGALDALLVSLPYDEAGIQTLAIYEEPLVVLLPMGHPLLQRATLDAKALRSECLLMLGKGHCFRERVLQLFPQWTPCDPEAAASAPRLEGSSLETIRYMVASGMGVSVVPCTAAGIDRYANRLVSIRRFSGEPPTRTVALAWRKSFVRPQVIDALARTIRSCSLSCVRMLACERPNPDRRVATSTEGPWPQGETLNSDAGAMDGRPRVKRAAGSTGQ